MESAVNHPKHYNMHPSGIECIEIIRHMSFNIGNAFKYVWRADFKNGIEDLKKALWYINDELANIDSTLGWGTWDELAAPLHAMLEKEPDSKKGHILNALGFYCMLDTPHGRTCCLTEIQTELTELILLTKP